MAAESVMGSAGTIRIDNRRHRNLRRTAAALPLLAVGAVGELVVIGTGWPASTLLPLALVLVPPAVLPRRLGHPWAQAYLEISRDGLDYGGRQRVTWDEIDVVRVRPQARRVAHRVRVLAPRWRPQGFYRPLPFGRIGLHVSGYDRRLDVGRVVEDLRRLAPADVRFDQRAADR